MGAFQPLLIVSSGPFHAVAAGWVLRQTRRIPCSSRVLSFIATLASLAAGCTTHSRALRSPRETDTGSSSSVVTGQELARLVSPGSLMDALRQLRPSWFVPRGSSPLVSVDGSTPTELPFLQLIPVSTVHDVRLQRSSSGRAVILPNGDVIVGDMIVVSTRRGR